LKYAIIDIETTGGSPRTEKITEIAIFIHDGKQVVDEFTTLINPERYIPPFITALTGISNEMVAHAPKFYEVAKEIVLRTEDAIFVAHNAPFDYGFVKEEFKNLGFDFQRKTLDTVRLSRKLIPGHASYSLGNICKDLGIQINGRHRAAGDALATVKLFEILLQKNGAFTQATDPEKYRQLKGIDSSAHRQLLEKLPDATGVYYLFDQDQQLIYIGKSVNIRSRVAQHLRNMGGKKVLEMRQRIADVSFELTGSELVALLLESDEIKKHKPIYNRLQRRSLFQYGLFTEYNTSGYITFSLKRISTQSGLPIASYVNMDEAKNHFSGLIERFELCQKLCGLYESEGACFHHGVGLCHGACMQLESNQSYNHRAKELIASFEFASPDFLLLDKGRTKTEKAVIRIKNGKYLGFGFADTEFLTEPDQLADSVKPKADNRDVQQIIRSYIRQGKYQQIILSDKTVFPSGRPYNQFIKKEKQ